jgi:hypothetical protein
MSRTKGYWITTGIFCAAFAMGGFMHLIRADQMAESMQLLGYPAYVMTLLGVAKLLGVAAVLVPGRPYLREWAYAGFTFDLLGATASHLFVGDPIAEIAPPFVLLGVVAASYHLRPQAQRLAAPPALQEELT